MLKCLTLFLLSKATALTLSSPSPDLDKPMNVTIISITIARLNINQ